MASVGNIFGSIRMRTTGLKKDLAVANKEIRGFTNRTSTNFKKAVSSITSMHTALIGLGSITIGLGIGKAVKEFTKFEDALLDLQKVLSDTEGNALQFVGTVEQLSNRFAVASADVLQSTANFKQAGFSIKDSFELTKQSLTAVKISELDVNEASELLIATLKGFKAPASETARLLDVMNEVSNKYATSLGELARGMSIISPIAKLMGFSFEETAGLLTPIIEVFRSGSEAGNALKIGLLRLIDDNKQVTDALTKIGVAQKDANGQLRSGRDILLDVQKAFLTLDPAMKVFIAQQLAGARQAARLLEVLNGLEKTTAVTTIGINAHGSAEKELQIRLQATSTALGQVKETFNNLFREIGGFFNPAILRASELTIRFINSLKTGGALNGFVIILKEIVKQLGFLAESFISVARTIRDALRAADSGFRKFKGNFGAGRFDPNALGSRGGSNFQPTGTVGLVTSANPLINFLATNRQNNAVEELGKDVKKTTKDFEDLDKEIQHKGIDLQAMADQSDTSFDRMRNSVNGWASQFSSTLTDVFFGAQLTFGNIARSFAKMITQMIIQVRVIEPLLNSFLGGGFSNAPTGGITGPPNLRAPKPQKSGILGLGFLGLADGGIVKAKPGGSLFNIGEGGKDEAVIPLDRLGQLGKTEVSVTVIGVPEGTRTEETETANGGKSVLVIIDEQVAKNVRRPGSKTNQAIASSFAGMNNKLTGR